MLNKAIVDLNKIRENAFAVKSRLPKETKFCAVVKANAYGHGSVAVANALYGLVDCFAVALVEEGEELRYGGVDKEILVLSRPFGADFVRAVQFDLTLTLTSVEDLKLAQSVGEQFGKTISFHVKFDSGMNRQGVSGLSDLKEIFEISKGCPNVNVVGIYSHYACPEKDKVRKTQTQKFLSAVELSKSYNKDITAHISASGGFIKGEYLDMVRIGILLYGYQPYDSAKFGVFPAMKIFSPIVCKRRIKKGEGALYGLKKAVRKTDVCIVRYGYADGLERKRVKGQFSNRCMDLTAVIDNGERDSVLIMDNAEKLSKKYKTISYEILTKSAMRAEIIYIN